VPGDAGAALFFQTISFCPQPAEIGAASLMDMTLYSHAAAHSPQDMQRAPATITDSSGTTLRHTQGQAFTQAEQNVHLLISNIGPGMPGVAPGFLCGHSAGEGRKKSAATVFRAANSDAFARGFISGIRISP
jgi:hypothetical protein